MADRLRPAAGFPALNRLGRGVFRWALAVLVLACAILAGLPQDRGAAASRSGSGLSASAISGHGHAAIASIAMGDPDDGFDDAVRMATPSVADRRPSVRLHAPVAASGDTANPIRLERPPRIRG